MIWLLRTLAFVVLAVLSFPLLASGVVVPAITSLSPVSGIPGQTVTIRGTNFGKTQGSSTVTFSGMPAAVTSWKATVIVVQVPAGAVTGPVIVTVNGQSSTAAQFTIAGPPQILSLSALSGGPGTSLTISGNNFGARQLTSTITFNGVKAAITSWSSTTIVATVPLSASSGPVIVTVGGVASPGVSFQVVSGPRITSLSPALAPAGTVVTITGTNFGRTQASSIVNFSGNPVTPLTWSATSIVVGVPGGVNSGPVTVSVGGVQSPGSNFIVVPAGGPYAYSLVTADFDSNHLADLAIVNRCRNAVDCVSGSVGVFLNNGDGTFQTAATYPTGGIQSVAAAAGDLDRDGIQDLAVVNNCATTACTNGSVSILLGNGDGSFQSTANFSSGGYQPSAIAIGDFNGDGNLDLAIANTCANTACGSGSTVTILLAKGGGTFYPAVSYSSGGQGALSIATGDFNGDNYLDLAVVNNCVNSGCPNGGSVGLLLGRGDGTFNPAVSYPSGGVGADSVAVGDFNGDGLPDLAVLNTCSITGCFSGGALGVLTGNGDGTFQAPHVTSSGGSYPYSVVTGDFNADGYSDAVITNQSMIAGNSNAGSAAVLLSNGDATFRPALNYSTGGASPFSAAVLPFRRYGFLNLAFANSCASVANCANGTLTLLPGNGDGTFGVISAYSASGASSQTSTPSEHLVTLSWNESSSGIVGYNIYRALVSGGPYTKMNALLDPTTNFADGTVAGGQTYYYVSTAVNGTGQESGFSNEIQTVIPSP